ncbi:MAG: ParB N-terminal domain-containing protein, partial [Nitrososphaeraceae archaeon]|nr:ParB N-terminal domain-containing protein [Nitrososphaeraceae archaeon]
MAQKTREPTQFKDFPIITLNVNDIKEDPTNPNVMTLEQERGLEKSMVNFGRLKYIVVDQNNIIIDGYHRLQVEKANGTESLQVIQVPVDNEIDRKMMRETLNQLHGEYNKEKQSSELLAIFESRRLDELSELLAQPKQDFENLITKYNPDVQFVREEDDTKLPSLYDTEPFVKTGEIWQLGRHRLMCGDCTVRENIDKILGSKKVDICFTSPPY